MATKSLNPFVLVWIGANLLFFTSCHQITEYRAMKRMVNDTEHQVTIRVFGTDEEFIYELMAQDTLEIKGKCFSGHQSYCSIGWTSSLQHIDLIFDQTKILSLSDCGDGVASISWDPLQCPGFESETEDSGYKIYTYIITESDFEAAIPITD